MLEGALVTSDEPCIDPAGRARLPNMDEPIIIDRTRASVSKVRADQSEPIPRSSS